MNSDAFWHQIRSEPCCNLSILIDAGTVGCLNQDLQDSKISRIRGIGAVEPSDAELPNYFYLHQKRGTSNVLVASRYCVQQRDSGFAKGTREDIMRDLNEVFCCRHSRSQPRHPRFTLCPECYAEAPHEARVVEAVGRYFSRAEFSEFFIETEREVQMGADTRRADVVLVDSKGSFAAIAECKRVGYVGYGIEQLKSYLCATATPFGIFANSIKPDVWTFYGNLGQNRFNDITRSQFEARLVGSPQRLKPTYSSRASYARRRQLARRAKQQRD